MNETIDIHHLQQWVGRRESSREPLGVFPARALSATLDRDDSPLGVGDELPALWHWLYFLPSARLSETGPDGHPRRGAFLPPVALPRRMWAGGRLRWYHPLTLGEDVERVSTIESVTYKSGRSGELVFVQVRHVLADRRGASLTEEQDIVYRQAARAGDPAPLPKPCTDPFDWVREVTPGSLLLFRYSALTFNGHRIHYDREYAVGTEGYPGLVVHGPLIATLLADLARANLPGRRLTAFEFRAVRPTFDLHPFRIKGRLAEDRASVSLWAENHEGFLAMHATAQLNPGA